MLGQYQHDFSYSDDIAPAIVYPINVASAAARITSMSSSDSCSIGGVTESCSEIQLAKGASPPPSTTPDEPVPAGSGVFAPVPVLASGSGAAAEADPNDHGGYTTGSSVANVTTASGITTVTVVPALGYSGYQQLAWPDVSLPGESDAAGYWSSSALTVAQWAVEHGFGISQNGLSPGWALNWHGYSYLQGSKTRIKSPNYFPEVPGSPDAQTVISLREWMQDQSLTPPVMALQTVSAMTEQCSTAGAAVNEANTCTPFAQLSPTSYRECARWKLQWITWLAQSDWSYNPRDDGLPGYTPSSLELYSSDLDDELAVDQRTNKADGLQAVQATVKQWSTNRTSPVTPPSESRWTSICP
jgi:hypothetical protein